MRHDVKSSLVLFFLVPISKFFVLKISFKTHTSNEKRAELKINCKKAKNVIMVRALRRCTDRARPPF